MKLNTEEQARYDRFLNSGVVQEHQRIRDEVCRELHLDFELRINGMHAVCSMCRGSVAQLTERHDGHETGFVHTVDNLATLFMMHFMQRHYEQEGRIA